MAAARAGEAPYTPAVAGKRADSALTTMYFIHRFTLQWAWTDLTDDEFFWEPFPGSWSVRRREDCQTPTPFGSGDWVVDFDSELAVTSVIGKAVEPITTIAWLMWHCGSMSGRTAELDFLGGSKTAESGWTSPYIADHPRFTSAAEAVEAFQSGWRGLRLALEATTDEQLEQLTRYWGYPGPGPAAPGHHIVASVLNEISHHGTQICMLRDLFRVGARRPPTGLREYAQ